jgi:hypothetical protein
MRRRKPSSESDGSRPASNVNCASAVRSAASSTSALSSWKRSPAGSASSSRKPPCRQRHDRVGLGQLQHQAPLPAAACALRLADGWPGTGHGAVGPIPPISSSPAATSLRHTCSCSACQSKPAVPHSASVAQALKRQGAGCRHVRRAPPRQAHCRPLHPLPRAWEVPTLPGGHARTRWPGQHVMLLYLFTYVF